MNISRQKTPKDVSISGFKFNSVIIIKSLEEHETDTANITSQFIASQISNENLSIPIDVLDCQYAGQFRLLMNEITGDAFKGRIPLIHIECHGDINDGIEFANGSTISWSEIADILLPLNIATKFNLLTVFSACFGAHFIGQMGAIRPAPCWCLVAPTETVDPGEILLGLRTFYLTLFKNRDVGDAVAALSKCSLSKGRWLSTPAELWFQDQIRSYIENYCNHESSRIRAKSIYRELKASGKRGGIGAAFRTIRRENRNKLSGYFFDVYFMIDKIPENSVRFAKTRGRVDELISIYRESGDYII